MKLECTATVLNLRDSPRGSIVAEMRQGDVIDVPAPKANLEWVQGEVVTGVSAGKSAFVRRKWLIQSFDSLPQIAAVDRAAAAEIVGRRTAEYDAVTYGLGSKAKSWLALKADPIVDCSGWVFLLAKEIMEKYGLATSPKTLYTYSDEQITRACDQSKQLISGRFLREDHFQPGTLIGLDFAEYAWDRGRSLDIDHIVTIGADDSGRFVSQSSSHGGGVNKVRLDKWLSSVAGLLAGARVHLVDLLSLK
jgi:hypothetical protein